MDLKNNEILIVYFSHKGQNYSNGNIVELEKGNTAVIADMIANLTNGTIFEIHTIEEYPFEYNDCVARARKELSTSTYPQLVKNINIAQYDSIFLGYPNWCGTMPMPIWTFLASHDFLGKTIFPFCTHEGSGMANSEVDLKKLINNADIRKGLAIHGSSVNGAELSVKKWIEKEIYR